MADHISRVTLTYAIKLDPITSGGGQKTNEPARLVRITVQKTVRRDTRVIGKFVAGLRNALMAKKLIIDDTSERACFTVSSS